ncbi:Retrovirus-related Pol polyprotein from transposon [Apostichopus japonicus]|uniref:Retrovirus-related Pol polyprotein from transposon n=1 Tax=Stichopus japonicus TaxID=307972 RepID=A0A2G8KXH7_STIJA|nr:Retrovirus-related Pol polyprotein from transposon [Apostichopus japonicus]
MDSDQNEEWRDIQVRDKDVGLIVLWKQIQNSRPTWEQVASESPTLRNYWTQWDRLQLRDGVLHRCFESGTGATQLWQLVVPQELQEEILENAHNHRLSGHLMGRKTLGRIRDHFYWSGYRRAVEKWCKNCDTCASRKGPMKRPKGKMKQYISGEPLQRCAMDIMGPLPVSDRGNKYVLVIADYFSKWTEAYAMPDMEAETVANILVEEFLL